MKVLFVSSGNSKDGISPIVKSQGESLRQNGVDLHYFTIKGKGFKGYLSNIKCLKRVINNLQPDIVHAHYSLTAIIATLAGAKPLVVSLMGSDVHAGGWQKWLIKVFVKKRWAFTIAKSKELAEKVGENHCLVIPNGVDMETFYPISKDIAKQKLGLDLSKRYLFFAHKKIKYGDKVSGSKGIDYVAPPESLLNFVRELCKKHNFNFMAIDIFEDGKGGYLVNELQTIFGHVQDFILAVNDQPGRYIYEDSRWIFDPGDFNTNESYDLRLETAINLYRNRY